MNATRGNWIYQQCAKWGRVRSPKGRAKMQMESTKVLFTFQIKTNRTVQFNLVRGLGLEN